jgi:hypothetical protein
MSTNDFRGEPIFRYGGRQALDDGTLTDVSDAGCRPVPGRSLPIPRRDPVRDGLPGIHYRAVFLEAGKMPWEARPTAAQGTASIPAPPSCTRTRMETYYPESYVSPPFPVENPTSSLWSTP